MRGSPVLFGIPVRVFEIAYHRPLLASPGSTPPPQPSSRKAAEYEERYGTCQFAQTRRDRKLRGGRADEVNEAQTRPRHLPYRPRAHDRSARIPERRPGFPRYTQRSFAAALGWRTVGSPAKGRRTPQGKQPLRSTRYRVGS